MFREHEKMSPERAAAHAKSRWLLLLIRPKPSVNLAHPIRRIGVHAPYMEAPCLLVTSSPCIQAINLGVYYYTVPFDSNNGLAVIALSASA